MANAARVNFDVKNLTQTVTNPVNGIVFVQGQSIRGPFSDPSEIINSWPRYVALFGGLSGTSDAPLLCKRLLEKGGSIRFNRVGNYTDITNASTLTAVKATQGLINILTFDAEITDQIDLDVNGESITIPFDTDSDTTIDNLETALKALAAIETAQVVESGVENGNRVLLLSSKSVLIIDNISTSGPEVLTVNTKTGALDKLGNNLFDILPKNEGVDYNNFEVIITGGSNGAPGYFNIIIQHSEDLTIVETYENLIIENNTTAEESNYLSKIISQSQYVDIVYKDLSSITGLIEIFESSTKFTGGSNGTTPNDADYIGDSATKTGFYAFDQYADSNTIAVFDSTADAVHIAGSAYAANRKDLVYFLELNNTLNTPTLLISKRTTLNIDTKYTYIFAGGLKITDPVTSKVKEIQAIADILALVVSSDKNFGPWYSFAGPNRGIINSVLGVVNNFGANSNTKDLDDLANKHINMVINRAGSVKLWGNFSAQYKNDQESQMSITRLVMFLTDSLRPVVEGFLEEPNDIPTWKRMYFTVRPFLDQMVTSRALYSYVWQGDQLVSSLNDLAINNATDVGNGKYKVNLLIKPIPSIQEINVNIILSPTGVEFEVVSELI